MKEEAAVIWFQVQSLHLFERTEENQSNFSQDGNKLSDSIRGGEFILQRKQ
jgi:hypothetical protein